MQRTARAFVCLLAATGTVAIVGCESSSTSTSANVERRMETVDNIDDMRQDLKKADNQVVLTQQSLDRLSTQQAGDLKQTFDDYRGDVSKNEAMVDRINGRATALSSDSYRHINEWNYQARTIQDENLRRQSLDRESQAKKEHDQMVTALNDLRGTYSAYVRELRDIETFASSDLTPRGITSIKDQRAKADQLAQQVRQKMATLDQQLDRMAQAWTTDVPLASRIQDSSARPAGSEMDANTVDTDTNVPANQPAKPDDNK